MARILTQERSLRRQAERLARERTWLTRLSWLWWPAGGLTLAGVVLWLWRGQSGILLLGSGALFVAWGQALRRGENQAEARSLEIGRQGEAAIAGRLARELGEEAWVLNDVTLRAGGRRAQTDHVVLAPNGLFVIETKNWAGTLSGLRSQPLLALQTRHDRRPRPVKNPWRQNQRQAAVLRAGLERAGQLCPQVTPLLVMASPHFTNRVAGVSAADYCTPETLTTRINTVQVARPYDLDWRTRTAQHLGARIP